MLYFSILILVSIIIGVIAPYPTIKELMDSKELLNDKLLDD